MQICVSLLGRLARRLNSVRRARRRRVRDPSAAAANTVAAHHRRRSGEPVQTGLPKRGERWDGGQRCRAIHVLLKAERRLISPTPPSMGTGTGSAVGWINLTTCVSSGVSPRLIVLPLPPFGDPKGDILRVSSARGFNPVSGVPRRGFGKTGEDRRWLGFWRLETRAWKEWAELHKRQEGTRRRLDRECRSPARPPPDLADRTLVPRAGWGGPGPGGPSRGLARGSRPVPQGRTGRAGQGARRQRPADRAEGTRGVPKGAA